VRRYTWSTLLVCTLLGAAVVGAPQSATAQSGISTVVMKFETSGEVPSKVTQSLYRALESSLSETDRMKVTSGGDITIGELAVTVGCDETKASCLTNLKNYVEGDRIVFGEIQKSEDVYLISMKMFDFAEERFVEEVDEQTLEGSPDEVAGIIPAVVDGFLFGDVGTLKVDVSGTSSARVSFDGDSMGPAPTTLENMPLGQHAITVTTGDGSEKSKIVVLERGKTKNVSFQFGEPSGGGIAGGGTSGPPLASGIAAGGAGLVGVAIAIAGQVQVSNNVSRGNEIMSSDGNYVKPGYTGDDARSVDQGIRTGNTFRIVGASIGAVGLGVGSYLLYRHFSSRPESGPGTSPAEDGGVAEHIRIAPGPEGVHLGVTFDFQ